MEDNQKLYLVFEEDTDGYTYNCDILVKIFTKKEKAVEFIEKSFNSFEGFIGPLCIEEGGINRVVYRDESPPKKHYDQNLVLILEEWEIDSEEEKVLVSKTKYDHLKAIKIVYETLKNNINSVQTKLKIGDVEFSLKEENK